MPTERINEGHIAIRFGDRSRDWRVYLDSEDVTNRTPEAVAGRPGWVILFRSDSSGSLHACQTCHEGACQHKVVGNVSIAREAVPA